MAIGTGDTIHKFGTQDLVTVATPNAIANGAMSLQTDTVAWTNTDDAPDGEFVFRGQYSGTLGSNPSVNVYARKLNIQGTNDENVPTLTNKKHFIANLKIDGSLAQATNEFVSQPIELPNGVSQQQYEFYIENKIGAQISSGWQAWVTPIALGPA